MDYASGLQSAEIYNSFNGLNELKTLSKKQTPESIEKIAKQFEALMLQTLLKSVRDTNKMFADNEETGEQMDFYYEMFDQQLAQTLAGKGFGFAEMISSQLKQNMNINTEPKVAVVHETFIKKTEPPIVSKVSNLTTEPMIKSTNFSNPIEFIKGLWNDAKLAAQKIGLDPKVMLAQAALETGWGSRIPSKAAQSSFNLFGIKADKSWSNEKLFVNTIEYVDGVAVKQKDYFRQYQSFMESLTDYVKFLKDNPRYKKALNFKEDAANFLNELHLAGFATDPKYKEKIMAIMNSGFFEQALGELS